MPPFLPTPRRLLWRGGPLLVLLLLIAAVAAARADELIDPGPVQPAVTALVNRAAEACRQRLAERFKASRADVDLWLVPGQRIALESGERGLADLRREGLTFGWMLPQRPSPAPIGDCRSDGQGEVRAIEQQPD